MDHEEMTLVGQRGIRLYAQRWIPESQPVGAIVITHGYAEHSDRYRGLAEALTGSGWAVYAFDHRGHGRSQGRRAVTDHLSWLVADVDVVVERARAATSHRRPVLLGHSMGGGVAAAYALQHQAKLAALVLSAPALGMDATVPAAQRTAMKLVSAVAPALGTVALDASGVSRDPEVVSAYQADPMVFHGKVPARTAREMLRASDLVAARARELRLPLLVMHGGADPIVPVAGSRALERDAASSDKTLTVYDGLYHEIFNEPEREKVISDLIGWLSARVGAA